MFSDTFAGIAPSSAPAFIAAQVIGGALAVLVIRALYPRLTPEQAADIVVPHHQGQAGAAGPCPGQRRRHPASRAEPRTSPGSPPQTGATAMHLVMIGGSDAGISAALRARELDPSAEVTVVVADAYPNFSICGIPYYLSGEVTHWRNLAHRTVADLEATGMSLRLDTTARRIDAGGRKLAGHRPGRRRGTPQLRQAHRRHRRGPGPAPRSAAWTPWARMTGCTCCTRWATPSPSCDTLQEAAPASAVIVGAGYIGLEMADALTTRGLPVIQMEQLPQVLPTVDPALGALVHAQLTQHGAEVLTGTTARQIRRAPAGAGGRLRIDATAADGSTVTRLADMVLVVVGVRPDTTLAADAGATLGVKGAIAVDPGMRTNLPGRVRRRGLRDHPPPAARPDLPARSAPPPTSRAGSPGENALGGNREFAGSLGTQVVKIFDQAAARTGLRDHEAAAAGFDPVTVASEADDHKAYYPGSHRIAMRFTGDRTTGRLLGVQLFGHRHAEIAKRIDIAATAIFHGMTIDGLSDLDLSYTPPLGSPWDAIQMGAQAWARETRQP